MEKWNNYINTGNQFFDSENLNDAKVQYRYACQRALQLLPDWIDTKQAVLAIITSYKLMAELCIKENQPFQGQQELEHVYGLILEALDKRNLFEDRRLGLLEGLHRTRSLLLAHIDKYGSTVINITQQQHKSIFSNNKR